MSALLSASPHAFSLLLLLPPPLSAWHTLRHISSPAKGDSTGLMKAAVCTAAAGQPTALAFCANISNKV
jgi:hypothetical protein